ncbi:hypothetical protein HTV80_00175 [Streptomyces sp. Vc74B-19]|uniref:hypothetical protein n=1 Tax=Streptomyces sp. Vc74B-19 TaxID=2741324 RepID=UPI001BFC9A09|nr:hypothetical protein [Streptomyces sp. Vc74B-19]MBT3161530.1 hypothetical protein [Streptomyces sp. Vc74B-19]
MNETLTFYYLYPDGSFGERKVTGVDHVHHPDGVVLLTQEEYAQKLADFEAQLEAEDAAAREAEQAQKRADYEALLALGVPAETASRMSGYVPPAEDEPPADGDD